MNPYSLDSNQCHVLFDASLKPRLTIDSGDIVTFRTLDACWGEVRSIEDFHRYRQENQRGSNPIAGPVAVRGVCAGDTLAVDVVKIDLDPEGFQLIGPNRALIVDEIRDWACHRVQAEGNRLRLSNGLELPAEPVIGELGTAPAGEPTNKPNRCGGNLDCPFVRTGARVYLPVEVDGALFSVGDVHARQGDGEIAGAPEIGATVTLKFQAHAGRVSNWPLIEDTDWWHAIASASNEAAAIRIAVFELAELIARHTGTSIADAMVLLTMTAEIHCCRTGHWGNHGPVASVSIRKSWIPEIQICPSKF